MLEYLEVKNFFMFIGCDLDRYEDAIAKGGSYDKMLEDLGSTEVDGWLRRCCDGAGTSHDEDGGHRLRILGAQTNCYA
jgi:hypothetical protein